METPASKVSYRLLIGPTREQTEADLTFRGGVPKMPAERALPCRQKCGAEVVLQVAYPQRCDC